MRFLALAIAVALLGSIAAVTYAGEVSLTIVNVVTPQDVKIWEPTSITARRATRSRSGSSTSTRKSTATRSRRSA
jgi:hypothetical protein